MKRFLPWFAAAGFCLLAVLLWKGPGGSSEIPAPPTTQAPAVRRTATETAATLPRTAAPAPTLPKPTEPRKPAEGDPTSALLEKLQAIAGPELAKAKAELIGKLVQLMEQHPGDESWESGAIETLAEGLPKEEALALWKRAADAFPDNLSISDKLIRMALTQNRLGDILPEELKRHPGDGPLLWLSTGLALSQGSPEEAERFLLRITDKTPFRECAGIPEMGAVRVHLALEPASGAIAELKYEMDAVAASAETLLPTLSRYKQTWKVLEPRIQAHLDAGEPGAAQALIQASATAFRAAGEGSRNLVTDLVALSQEKLALRALADRAAAGGLLVAKADAEARLQALEEERQSIKAWTTEDMRRLENAYAEFERLQAAGVGLDPAALDATMSPELRKAVTTLSHDVLESSEMARYRAWKSARPTR